MSRVDSGNESQEGSPDTTASEPALLHTPPRLSAVLTQVRYLFIFFLFRNFKTFQLLENVLRQWTPTNSVRHRTVVGDY